MSLILKKRRYLDLLNASLICHQEMKVISIITIVLIIVYPNSQREHHLVNVGGHCCCSQLYRVATLPKLLLHR